MCLQFFCYLSSPEDFFSYLNITPTDFQRKMGAVTKSLKIDDSVTAPDLNLQFFIYVLYLTLPVLLLYMRGFAIILID